MSVFYWEERMLTFDNAFQIFLMICDQRIEVMADRWPAASVRLLPMFCVDLGFSIKTIAIVFSLSYVLVQYCFFVLVGWILKQKRLAFLLLAAALFATSEGFFWCNSEQIHGLSACILLLASYNSWKGGHRPMLSLMLGILTFVMVLFYHPLLLFPTFFLLVYHQLDHGFKDRSFLLVLIGFVASWFAKRHWMPNWYDNGKAIEFNQFFDSWIGRFFDLPSVSFFMDELWSKYHLLALGALLCGFLLIKQKKWLHLLFVLASCIVYLVVVLIGNPEPVNSFYVETNFYTLVVFLYYPILVCLGREKLETKWFYWLFTALLLGSMLRIIWFSSGFESRVGWVKKTIDNQACNKVLVDNGHMASDVKMLTWSLPYESLIHSQETKRSRSIHWKNEQFVEEGKYQADQWITGFNTLDSQYIDNVYFDWPGGEYCDYKTN